MKHLLILIFILTQAIEVLGQEINESQILRGKIYSDSEQIMFATVGIIGENIGTVCDQTGHFKLEIPNAQLEKKLTFSHIGYESLSLNLDSLIRLDKVVIQLTEKIEYLDELVISSEKLNGKTKEYGNTKKHNLFLWIQNGDKGSEIATLVTPKSETHLNSVSINVLNESQKNFTLLLNIYVLDHTSKLPGRQLLRNQHIINSNIQKGWLEIDLRNQNLVISEPFFVGFQWTNVDEPIPLVGGKSGNSRKSLIRYKALGTWEEFAEWDIKVSGTVYKSSITPIKK